MTAHDNHLHDHQADTDALHDAMVEDCKKYIVQHFDFERRSEQLLENISLTALRDALGRFMAGESAPLRQLLSDEAEAIAGRSAKKLVSAYGTRWLVELEGLDDE